MKAEFRILIFGASSAIVQQTARLFASGGARLYLVARDSQKLSSIRDDLVARGASEVQTAVCDALDFRKHVEVVNDAWTKFGGLDAALIGHGTLPDQKGCEASFEEARNELEINFLSVVSLVSHLANRFEAQKGGRIAVITSVAGDRGRGSNYVYGAAKGGVSIFLEGLRQRLHKSGVGVTDIRAGFVNTPMTKAFKKGMLWAEPALVARDIRRALLAGTRVLYTPWYWRVIMLVIRTIPRSLFVRMNL